MQIIGTDHGIVVNAEDLDCAHVRRLGDDWELVANLTGGSKAVLAKYGNLRDAGEALEELNRQITEGRAREAAWAAEGKEEGIKIYASELVGDALFRSLEDRANGSDWG